MKEYIKELIKLGPIPPEDDMPDGMFEKYDTLLASSDEPLTYEEAEQLIVLFSSDCYDLNWFLLHAIESVPFSENIEKYNDLIQKCNNKEFKETLNIRLQNYLKK